MERLSKSPSKVIDILEASNEELEGLKEKIAVNNGVVHVLVHPFSNFNHSSGIRYYQELDIKLKRLFELSAPIIFFDTDELINRLDGMNYKNIYLIKSCHPQDPEPTEGWNEVKALFNKLEVKKAIVGGMKLTYYTHEAAREVKDNRGKEWFKLFTIPHNKLSSEQQMTQLPTGCVGLTIIALKLFGISVIPSIVSFPHKYHPDYYVNSLDK